MRKVLDKHCKENQNTYFFNKILNQNLSFMRECGTNIKYIVTFQLQQCYDIYIYITLSILLINQCRVFLTLSFAVTARVKQD